MVTSVFILAQNTCQAFQSPARSLSLLILADCSKVGQLLRQAKLIGVHCGTGGATQSATADSTNTEIRRQCLHGASDISSSCHHLGIKENVLWILSCWHIWIYEPRQVFPFPQTLQGNKAPGKSSVVMISQESCEESSVKLLIGSISDQEKHLKSIRRMLNLTNHYKILWEKLDPPYYHSNVFISENNLCYHISLIYLH